MLSVRPAHRFVLGVFLCLVMALGAGCGDRADGEGEREWLSITRANAGSVASTIWLDNVTTDVSDFMPEVFELLDDFLPLVAMQPSGDQIDFPCEVSGRIFLSGQVADPERAGWTAGDRVTAAFEACVREPPPWSEQIDGEMDLTIQSAGDGERAFEVTHTDLMLTIEELGALTANATFTVTTSLEGGVQILTSSTEEATTVGPGVAETAFDHTVRLVDAGDTFELSYSATLESGRLGGAVRYETAVPFTGPSDGYPTAGELLVTGANESNVRLVALSSNDVRLEIDEDGDGAVDTNGTLVMTWQNLEDLP